MTDAFPSRDAAGRAGHVAGRAGIPEQDEMEVFDVVQVGYGPVGQAVAALLGRRGHRIAVFERQHSLYGLPRVGGVDHEIMRILQSLGVAAGLEAQTYPARGFDFLSAAGKTLAHLDWNHKRESGWELRPLVYQPDLEDALDQAVRSQPAVKVNQGWEAVHLEQYHDHAELTVQNRDTGQPRKLGARYIIGTDGASSFVRQAAGIEWVDLGYHSEELVIDYRPHDPESGIAGMPDLALVFDPAQPRFLMRRLGWKHARWEFHLLPGEDRDEAAEPGRCWERLAPWVTPADGELIRHFVYPFQSLVAADWRRGRVFLAGDAAHVMPPIMGQGLCTGIRDAAALAWKLDLVLRGLAGDSLLDAYCQERKPHAEAVIDMSVELARAWSVTDPAIAAARDTEMLAGSGEPPPPFPGLADGILHRDSRGQPLAPGGQLFVQDFAEYRGRTGRFDDVVGQGFVVMALDADPRSVLNQGQLASLDQVGARLVQVSSAYKPGPEVVADLRGTYARWLRERGLRAVVTRPDYYIFGAAASLEDLPVVVDSLRRQLRAGPEELLSPRRNRGPADRRPATAQAGVHTRAELAQRLSGACP